MVLELKKKLKLAHVEGVSSQCGIKQNRKGYKQIEPKVDNTC